MTAAWRALHGLRDSGPDTVELAAHGGMQPVPGLPERAGGLWLAMRQTRRAHEIARNRCGVCNGVELFVQHAGEGEQVVALVLQGAAHRADA